MNLLYLKSKMHFAVIVFILLSILCRVEMKESYLHLSVLPNKITPGLTELMQIECSINDIGKSPIAMLFSIQISHSMETDESNFTDIALVSSFGGLTTLTEDTINASGLINNKGVSYINISWIEPQEKYAGLYRCDVYGVNKFGKPVSSSRTARVTISSPTIEMALAEIRKLRLNIDQITSKTYHVNERITQNEKQLENEIGKLNSRFLNESDRISDLEKANLKIVYDLEYVRNATLRHQSIILNMLNISQDAFLVSSGNFEGRKYWLSRSTNFFNPTFAVAVCEMYGGYLAEIDTRAEFEFVRSFVSKFGYTNVMTGGTDENREGVWINRHSKTPVASFWYRNEPNNSGGNENCQSFHKLLEWYMNDAPCFFENTNSVGFVCETPEKVNAVKLT